jgi:hypothetical protein
LAFVLSSLVNSSTNRQQTQERAANTISKPS